jgi:hypothetical protein
MSRKSEESHGRQAVTWVQPCRFGENTCHNLIGVAGIESRMNLRVCLAGSSFFKNSFGSSSGSSSGVASLVELNPF